MMLVVNRLTVCFTGRWLTRPGGFALYLFLRIYFSPIVL